MDISDLANRFEYHKPDDARGKRHQMVRKIMHEAAIKLDYLLEEGREKSLAVTNLEQAMFWANASIAREGIISEPQT